MRITVGDLESLEPGEFEGVFRVDVEPTPVGLARVGERLFAFDARCPHRGADLTVFGQIMGDRSLRCGVHGHVFDLETGGCSDARDCDPRYERLVIFPAEQDCGKLWLLLPDSE